MLDRVSRAGRIALEVRCSRILFSHITEAVIKKPVASSSLQVQSSPAQASFFSLPSCRLSRD